MSGSAFAVTHHAFSSGAGRTSDGNGSHASTLKSPSYTKSVSWQHYRVRHLAAVDSEALQQQGALGVIILGQQVHAIFGKQSDALRQLLDEHFAARK